MNELILTAVAQNGGGAPPQQVSCLAQALPMLLIFAVFYFLLIRPQQKRQRQHQEMISRLKKGDRVITTGGLIGTIFAVTDDEVQLEVADKIRVRVAKPQVSLYGVTPETSEKKAAEADKKEK